MPQLLGVAPEKAIKLTVSLLSGCFLLKEFAHTLRNLVDNSYVKQQVGIASELLTDLNIEHSPCPAFHFPPLHTVHPKMC